MNLEKILEDYGLTKKQAKLYLTCLELGSASVYKISQKASLPRSTCYEVFEDLKEKGLVSTFRKKKVNYYSAESPKKIINQTEEKINLFKQAMPQFEAIYNSAKIKPSVRFYQGVQGMKQILEEILVEAKEILGFTSAEDHFIVLGNYWPDFVKRRIKLKIPVRSIITESVKAHERKKLGLQELRRVKIIPARYQHHGLIMIWGKKIAMFSFKKEMMAIVVESEELAQTQRMFFNFTWDLLKD